MNNNLIRCLYGVKNVFRNKYKILYFGFYTGFLFLLLRLGKIYILTLKYTFLQTIILYCMYIFIFTLLIFGIYAILIILGTPIIAKVVEEDLKGIKLCDKNGNSPFLVAKRKVGVSIVYTFYSKTNSREKFEELQSDLEQVIDGNIYSIEYTKKSKREIEITFVPSKYTIPDTINWNTSEHINQEDFVINLGVGLLGRELVNLNKMPHILIAGGTGSGKTILIKSILFQCLYKKAIIYIADFKGGIDYQGKWRDKTKLITSLDKLDDMVYGIIMELENRKALFDKNNVNSIAKYNKKIGNELSHIVLCIDEIAEVLDRTGLEKQEKLVVDRITSSVSTIARLGRAYGIHLMLCAQRPDAEIIKGQIKMNMSLKICGRVDKVSSEIILDNTDAVEKIRPDDVGMFLTNTGKLFRGYLLSDECLSEV